MKPSQVLKSISGLLYIKGTLNVLLIALEHNNTKPIQNTKRKTNKRFHSLLSNLSPWFSPYFSWFSPYFHLILNGFGMKFFYIWSLLRNRHLCFLKGNVVVARVKTFL